MSNRPAWKPTATLDTLKARASYLRTLRAFFEARGVVEVDTPLLCRGVATDPCLQAFAVPCESGKRFLQTSPEFAMKRLLAAGMGPIYYLGKAFRREERGSQHNPEFTLLEWYRPGWDHWALIQEVGALLQTILGVSSSETTSYAELFEAQVGISPHSATVEDLKVRAPSFAGGALFDKSAWLDYLWLHKVEPFLAKQRELWVIVGFPACQASLARIIQEDTGEKVAERFEIYYRGIELANGYHELTCAEEQKKRFQADLQKRAEWGYDVLPIDHALLAALTAGLPACAGVALGADRLFLLQQGAKDIADVIPFAWEWA